MNELEKINETIFESIRHVDDEGNEYWYARELQQILGYKEWSCYRKSTNCLFSKQQQH